MPRSTSSTVKRGHSSEKLSKDDLLRIVKQLETVAVGNETALRIDLDVDRLMSGHDKRKNAAEQSAIRKTAKKAALQKKS